MGIFVYKVIILNDIILYVDDEKEKTNIKWKRWKEKNCMKKFTEKQNRLLPKSIYLDEFLQLG